MQEDLSTKKFTNEKSSKKIMDPMYHAIDALGKQKKRIQAEIFSLRLAMTNPPASFTKKSKRESYYEMASLIKDHIERHVEAHRRLVLSMDLPEEKMKELNAELERDTRKMLQEVENQSPATTKRNDYIEIMHIVQMNMNDISKRLAPFKDVFNAPEEKSSKPESSRPEVNCAMEETTRRKEFNEECSVVVKRLHHLLDYYNEYAEEIKERLPKVYWKETDEILQQWTDAVGEIDRVTKNYYR